MDLSLLQQAAFDRIRAFSGADAIFEHVIVDEYQDTNPIQEKLFFALAGKYKNLSYVAVSGEDEGPDPDGLDHAARMALESSAIDLILLHELWWERTPTHNPGYDLYEPSGDGATLRWCEVKAMTGTLDERPVGLSHTQFEYAQKHGENYWLYVVEHAGTSEARILRIQDPAGKARTFMFDRGWVQVANV